MSKSNMIKLFKDLSYRHNLWITFSDFLELSALAISNRLDFKNYGRREKRYLEVIKKYSEKEAAIFPKLFSELVDELEKAPGDILGELFMELELGNKWKGQFFTPYNLCLLTAEVSFDTKAIEGNGYITLNEPACGGGAMIIAFAEVMTKHGYNPQKQLMVICQDLDVKSVYMSYIQLSLLGIPAAVYHGNTLSLEMFEEFKTPMWIIGGWSFKELRPKPKQKIKFIENEDGQFSFI